MNRILVERLFRTVLFYAIAQLIVTSAADAQSLDVDWKFYGSASQNMCFYDAKGMTRVHGDHIRVWTKCLRRKDLDSIDIQKPANRQILEGTAQKVAQHYIPPIAATEESTADQRVFVTEYEVMADLAGIAPQVSIFHELNCPERMVRELSISVKVNGKIGFSDKPSAWRYVGPETNGARLLRMLCPIL
jgi:hypothetical protein